MAHKIKKKAKTGAFVNDENKISKLQQKNVGDG